MFLVCAVPLILCNELMNCDGVTCSSDAFSKLLVSKIYIDS